MAFCRLDTGSIKSETPSEDEVDADELAKNSDEFMNQIQEEWPQSKIGSRPPTPTNENILYVKTEDELLLSTFKHQWTNNAAHANTQHAFE